MAEDSAKRRRHVARPKRAAKASANREGVKDNLSLTDRATATFRDRILDLTLPPGMTLDERQLLEKFEFGRTPMREAMNRLIVEGLVVARGQRGLQVAPLNIDAAVELFDAYVMIERMVAFALRFSDPDLVTDLQKLQASYVESLAPTDLMRVTEMNVRFHLRLARATQSRESPCSAQQPRDGPNVT